MRFPTRRTSAPSTLTVLDLPPPMKEIEEAYRKRFTLRVHQRRFRFVRHAVAADGLALDSFAEVSWSGDAPVVREISPGDAVTFHGAVALRKALAARLGGGDNVRASYRPDAIADMLADLIECPPAVRKEIKTRSTAYAARRGPPRQVAQLDEGTRARLRAASGPLPLRGPADEHGVDELVECVHARAPWMAPATMAIWHHLRAPMRAGRTGLSLPPILLHGPPGTGKSTLARILAEEAGIGHVALDAGSGTAAFRIAGVEAGWGARQIGEVVGAVCEHRVANPLVIVDEVDKIGSGASSSSGGPRTSLADALLPLLEPATAASWRCPASGLVMDLSRVVWILTANDVAAVNPVLRSRLQPIHVPALGRAAIESYVDIVFSDDLAAEVRHVLRDVPVGPRLTLRHVRRLADRLVGGERDLVH